jgi:hypothetical protein
VTNMVLKSLKRQINKYQSMTAGQPALSDCSVGVPSRKT